VFNGSVIAGTFRPSRSREDFGCRITTQPSGDNAKIEVLKDGFNAPTAVTRVGDTAWVLEGKLDYMQDPKLKDQDPGGNLR
jgi:hypothetical protein